jgi:hypothetical protein
MRPTQRLIETSSDIPMRRYKSIRKRVPDNINNFDNNIFNSPNYKSQSPCNDITVNLASPYSNKVFFHSCVESGECRKGTFVGALYE